MEKLIKLLAEKAEISEAQAKIAAEIMVEFTKQQLAGKAEINIREALSGEPEPSLLEKVGEYAEQAKAKIGDFADVTRTFFMSKLTYKDKDGKEHSYLGDAKDKIEDFAEDAKEKLGNLAGEAKEKLGDLAEGASKFFKNTFGGKKDDEAKENKENKEEPKK